MSVIRTLLVVLAFGLGTASAQDAPANNMDILKEKLSADKKLLVAANMGLTESEASAFWPKYEEFSSNFRRSTNARWR